MDNAVKFYEMLGFEIIARKYSWLTIMAGSTTTLLLELRQPAQNPEDQNLSLGFDVGDKSSLEAAVKELKDKNVNFTSDIITKSGVWMYVYFTDPDKNQLYLLAQPQRPGPLG